MACFSSWLWGCISVLFLGQSSFRAQATLTPLLASGTEPKWGIVPLAFQEVNCHCPCHLWAQSQPAHSFHPTYSFTVLFNLLSLKKSLYQPLIFLCLLSFFLFSMHFFLNNNDYNTIFLYDFGGKREHKSMNYITLIESQNLLLRNNSHISRMPTYSLWLESGTVLKWYNFQFSC